MNNISATAHLVAMYRALESECPDALFHDPFARRLAGGEGALLVELLGGIQQGTTVMAIRTCVIDTMIMHLLESGKVDTILNLGAGLDTRPYRLNLPASLRWIEIDLPAILNYKAQKLEGEHSTCRVERIGLDLMDTDARKAVFTQVNASTNQVIVLTEGLLPYLNEAQVASLALDLQQHCNFRWWLFELASALILQAAQKSKQQQLFDQYFAHGKPTFLFAPAQGADFFQPYGWTLNEFRSLWSEACRLKRQAQLFRFSGFPMRWFAKQSWQAVTQQTGFVLLERMP